MGYLDQRFLGSLLGSAEEVLQLWLALRVSTPLGLVLNTLALLVEKNSSRD